MKRTKKKRSPYSIWTMAAFFAPACALVYLFFWVNTGDPFSAQQEIAKEAITLEDLAIDQLFRKTRALANDFSSSAAPDFSRLPARETLEKMAAPFSFVVDDGGDSRVLRFSGISFVKEKTVLILPGEEEDNDRFLTYLKSTEEQEYIKADIKGTEQVFQLLNSDERFTKPAYRIRTLLAHAAFLKRLGRGFEIAPLLLESLDTVPAEAAPSLSEYPFTVSALIIFDGQEDADKELFKDYRRKTLSAIFEGRIPLSSTELFAVSDRLMFLTDDEKNQLRDKARVREVVDIIKADPELTNRLCKAPIFSLVSLGKLWIGGCEGNEVRGCAFPWAEALEALNQASYQVKEDTGFFLSLDEEGVEREVLAKDNTQAELIRQTTAPAGIEGVSLNLYLTDRSSFEKNVKSRRTFVTIAALLLTCAMLVLGFATLKAVRKEVSAAKARSDFMAAVSHELRTPLSSIRMFAELLEEDRIQDESVKARSLRLIISNCRRLSAMIENVLDLSRSEKGMLRFNVEEIDLGLLLKDLFNDILAVAEEEEFTMDVKIEDDLPDVMADPTALSRAIFNLCDNARKYGGEEKWIGLEAIKNEGGAQITISDRGMGMSPSEQKEIFIRFQQGKEGVRAASGAGLGLSLAREAIEACNGELNVESREGEGTKFIILLPGLDQLNHD